MIRTRVDRRMSARLAAVVLAAALAAAGAASGSDETTAASDLRAREAALAPALRVGAFRAPLYVESSEGGSQAAGEVYARVSHDFGIVAGALATPAQWCEVLVLHLNVKHCNAQADTVTLHLGSKHEQPLARAYRLDLRYTLEARSDRYLRIRMQAPSGPLGTRDTTLVLEATPSQAGATFLHFEYASSYGMFANLAMRAYLSTMGRDKVGFSAAAPAAGQASAPVAGMRGVVERNAMRYYLAIAAYLDSLAVPAADRLERRLAAWFDATERYPVQLHEIDRDEYLTMKRHEIAQPPS